jgi:hypothetical protein
VKAAARTSLTVAAAVPSGQVRPVRVVAVLLLLVIGLPGATSGSALRFPGVFGGPGAAAPVAAAPQEDMYYYSAIADRDVILSPAQLSRAATRHRQLPAVQRLRLDTLLATVPTRAQGYLLKAFAAGHSVGELATFARVIAPRDREWLRTRLSLVAPGYPGPVHYRGYLVRQYDDTSCGSTSIVVAHAMADPIYSFLLTTGGHPDTADETGERFLARLKAEEHRMHRATNLLWPAVIGTPPWGLRDQMNEQAMGIGGQYRWMVTEEWVTGPVDAVVRQALAAVDDGYPVPVLIGDAIPRHYVLLVHYDTAGALFYEPTSGAIKRVAAAALARRNLGVLGFPHLKGVILPGPPTG